MSTSICKQIKALGGVSEVIIKSVACLGNAADNATKQARHDKHNAGWKENDYPESYTHSPDFRPDLVQDFNLQTMLYEPYIADKHRFRVYMPLRKNRVEVNTKYMNQIIQIVAKHIPEGSQTEVSYFLFIKILY
jgi:hypothetical protein